MEHPVEKNVLLLIETAASEHNPYVDNISFCWFFSIKLLVFFFPRKTACAAPRAVSDLCINVLLQLLNSTGRIFKFLIQLCTLAHV